ncbi:MAG: DNA-directed RNA polymerase subunit P [Candidatus Aenigmarchaeota archaeon]|nr:DNA-directed RNA polymerase subunit P [Candidatus Aenigmarchaeota archaeon]
MYKCVSCKKTIAKLEDKIRCPYCGQRVFVKLRPEVVKRVLAR